MSRRNGMAPGLQPRWAGMESSSARRASVSVLHVVAPAEFGGLEMVVQALSLGARGSSVAARVAAVVPPGQLDHPFFAPFRNSGVEVVTIETPSRGYLAERRAVARLCGRLRPDVVHTHGYRADVVDAPVARGLGIPVVSTVHGFTGGDRKNRFYEWLQRRALRQFDAVVAVSHRLAAELERGGVPCGRLRYVQNAWQASEPPLDRMAACRALGVGDDLFRVGWVGRLSKEKGPDLLVEALRHLGDLQVMVSFLGDGPLRHALETRAAALRVAEHIRWHGAVRGAGRLFRAFGAFVLSSRTEGTPIALFEAMAAGVPIVAAAVGGVPDVVSTKEALLVPPEDSGALATALREVFQNPAAARTRARMAQERLERDFGLAAWLGRYEAVYRGIVRTPFDPSPPPTAGAS